MASSPERRRHRRTKVFSGPRDLTVICQTGAGPNVLEATLFDFSEDGMRIELAMPLSVGSSVEVIGDVEGPAGLESLRRRGSVVRCSENGNGGFVAGLFFQPVTNGSSPEAAAKRGESVDYYEVLQLSRNANSDTIQRVFRILAKRYHPDNRETGNAELFREVVEAARVLSDPKLRAAYDARLVTQNGSRFKIFETWQTSRGVDAEKRKRKGVLGLLYGRRLTDPQHPSLGLRDLETMLDCPREHLEFTLWFLKESKWIKASDSARYEITLSGVVAAEEDETYPLQDPVLQLSAPKDEG